MEKQAQPLLDHIVPEIAALQKQLAEAAWQQATTGEAQYSARHSEVEKKLQKIMTDEELLAQLESLQKRSGDSNNDDSSNTVSATDSTADSLASRQVQHLYLMALRHRASSEDFAELTKRTNDICDTFNRFRATYDGKLVSDNDIVHILQTEKDTYKRKEAWYASKQIGEKIAGKLIDLVKLRNRIAQKNGFRDYYAMSLAASEIDEAQLFTLCDAVKQKTDQPYADIKKEMDTILAKQYTDLRPEGLRPWHYVDPFCQQAPSVFNVDIDSYFADKKLEEIAGAFFQAIGLDVSDILQHSDLYEREGKNEHAYCMTFDREGDVRILCNLRPNEASMRTLLHTLGHAAYSKYVDRELPYLLRTAAHKLTTEGIALMFDRLTKNPAWLAAYASEGDDVPSEWKVNTEWTDNLQKQYALTQLAQLRWMLVVIYFERDLYANPDRNLNKRWWHYVETIQYIPCPEARNKPDWAANIDLSLNPVYYQNYLLGELMASQLWATLEEKIANSSAQATGEPAPAHSAPTGDSVASDKPAPLGKPTPSSKSTPPSNKSEPLVESAPSGDSARSDDSAPSGDSARSGDSAPSGDSARSHEAATRGTAYLISNEKTGAFLRKHIFAPGAKWHWNELLLSATGEKLNPDYYINAFKALVEQFVEVKKPKKPAKKAGGPRAKGTKAKATSESKAKTKTKAAADVVPKKEKAAAAKTEKA
ncbi:M2 family metallopeptidase [Numidum massiliense]|uniref:M2 family metallopeptidase n=1 Tax=Numidum massiliense TaxID=1522315 RepID=UPI0006D592E4|nr:M2 family metallopeptidase [Numidum massiliense]